MKNKIKCKFIRGLSEGCRARLKATDSRSVSAGIRRFESGPSHLRETVKLQECSLKSCLDYIFYRTNPFFSNPRVILQYFSMIKIMSLASRNFNSVIFQIILSVSPNRVNFLDSNSYPYSEKGREWPSAHSLYSGLFAGSFLSLHVIHHHCACIAQFHEILLEAHLLMIEKIPD